MEQNVEVFTINTAYIEEEVYAQIDRRNKEGNEQLTKGPEEVSKSNKLICERIVTVLGLGLVIFLLIVVFTMMGYTSAKMIIQQGRLSSQANNINALHTQLNNSTQLIKAQLNESEEHIKLLESLTDIEVLDQSLFLLENRRNPASSCSDIPQNRPSGEYWIRSSTGSPVKVYCDMNRTSCSCNTTGGWMRVANLDMTDPNQNCPDEFRLVTRTEPPLRMCGRPGLPGCVSTTYQTYGVKYSHVCGRIIAYQDSTPDAFEGPAITIDSPYIDGVSLTHGQSPRQHIWSFVAAAAEQAHHIYICPCTRPGIPSGGNIPGYVGQDYFCDTGAREVSVATFNNNNPLWDGQGCGLTSTCCHFNNPPWFCKQLPQPTTDDIELRICADQDIHDEDTPIERVELYIR